jgi:hypothetical protein
MRWFSMLKSEEKNGVRPVGVRATTSSETHVAAPAPQSEVTDLIAAFWPSRIGASEAALEWA